MSSNEPDRYLLAALAKAAAAVSHTLMKLSFSSEQALQVAADALRAAEPDLRRHMILRIAHDLEAVAPAVAQGLRDAVREDDQGVT